MIDTSALIAALVADHEHHAVARGRIDSESVIPAIVLAECFSQLRRTFAAPAADASALLEPWTSKPERILATSASSVATVLGRAIELDLGGNVHDALIAQVCLEHGVPLATLDARQHRLALALGADSTYLLA